MQNIHKTKDGRVVAIASMDNDHLKNTILMYVNNIKKYMSVVDWTFNVSWATAVVYDCDNDNLKRKAKQEIKSSYERLKDYVIEAVLRWIDMSKYLQDAMWRKENIEVQAIGYEEDYDDDPYN